MAAQSNSGSSGITWGGVLKGVAKIAGFVAVAYLMATGVEALLVKGGYATAELVNGKTVLEPVEDAMRPWVYKALTFVTAAVTGGTEMMANIVAAPFKGLVALFTNDVATTEMSQSWQAAKDAYTHAPVEAIVGAGSLLGTGTVLASRGKEESKPTPKDYKVYGQHTQNFVDSRNQAMIAQMPGILSQKR
jgi:hypothetical protein